MSWMRRRSSFTAIGRSWYHCEPIAGWLPLLSPSPSSIHRPGSTRFAPPPSTFVPLSPLSPPTDCFLCFFFLFLLLFGLALASVDVPILSIFQRDVRFSLAFSLAHCLEIRSQITPDREPHQLSALLPFYSFSLCSFFCIIPSLSFSQVYRIVVFLSLPLSFFPYICVLLYTLYTWALLSDS